MACVKQLICTHCNEAFYGFLNETPCLGIAYLVTCPKCSKQNTIELVVGIVDSPVPSDAVEIKRAS